MSWRNIQSLSGVTKPNGKIKQIAETKTVSAIFVISLSGRIKHIVGLRGVQFVNSLNSEQFVHDGNTAKRNTVPEPSLKSVFSTLFCHYLMVY